MSTDVGYGPSTELELAGLIGVSGVAVSVASGAFGVVGVDNVTVRV